MTSKDSNHFAKIVTTRVFFARFFLILTLAAAMQLSKPTGGVIVCGVLSVYYFFLSTLMAAGDERRLDTRSLVWVKTYWGNVITQITSGLRDKKRVVDPDFAAATQAAIEALKDMDDASDDTYLLTGRRWTNGASWALTILGPVFYLITAALISPLFSAFF